MIAQILGGVFGALFQVRSAVGITAFGLPSTKKFKLLCIVSAQFVRCQRNYHLHVHNIIPVMQYN